MVLLCRWAVKKGWALALILVVLFLGTPGTLSGADLTIVVDQPTFTPVVVRVPGLPGAPELTPLLREDLEAHLVFRVLTEPPLPGTHLQEYLVTGKVLSSGPLFKLYLELQDLFSEKILLRKVFSGSPSAAPYMVHRFVDLAVKEMAGFPGVASTWVAFVRRTPSGDELCLKDFSGKRVRVLLKAPIILSPRFSPEGRRLAFVAYRQGHPEIRILDLATGKIRTVAAFPGLNASPVWSPDGRHLVATLSKDGNPDLYLLDLSGRILRRLTFGQGVNTGGSFSPDGRYLAFVSDRTGSPQIYLYDFETGGTRRLTYEGRYNVAPRWSPRGDRLVFAGQRQGRFLLFTVDPEGGRPLAISGEGSYEAPAVAPNGYFVLARGKGPEGEGLYLFLINGAARRLYLPGPILEATWGPWPQ
ncbi:hypothetical protein FVE67_01630 [Thermosulfurimonas marina]|uniref:Tol-Pal system beta propeller repeat protein TolB n=1 Tax=Thermosulfurimonas marina TaxID=2047767 RepID=A0A6H1WQZ1_9BACT|nr:PD40 domain-containing protein [Thermosulfurimonas marina]QJA05574.1 hypothetical protein FVE67_01630 [Thermosulfurimonas marina]